MLGIGLAWPVLWVFYALFLFDWKEEILLTLVKNTLLTFSFAVASCCSYLSSKSFLSRLHMIVSPEYVYSPEYLGFSPPSVKFFGYLWQNIFAYTWWFNAQILSISVIIFYSYFSRILPIKSIQRMCINQHCNIYCVIYTYNLNEINTFVQQFKMRGIMKILLFITHLDQRKF